MIEDVTYKAVVVEEDNTTNTYNGITKSAFKETFYRPYSSFINRDEEHSTTLSTHIWTLKDSSTNFDIQWSVIDRGRPGNSGLSWYLSSQNIFDPAEYF